MPRILGYSREEKKRREKKREAKEKKETMLTDSLVNYLKFIIMGPMPIHRRPNEASRQALQTESVLALGGKKLPIAESLRTAASDLAAFLVRINGILNLPATKRLVQRSQHVWHTCQGRKLL